MVNVFNELKVSLDRVNSSDLQIVINHSLAWGGAERQLINMVTGMVHDHQKNIMVVCEDLTSDPHYEFYLWQLKQKQINISEMDKSRECFSDDNSSIDKIIELFPEYIQNDIWSFYLLFKEKKPSVVHAWQDSTSIKVAVAALAAGVPHIIMCTRNIAPENFAYIQPYMKPAYQALLECETVCMINNSRAGALDYERWLGLEENTVDVVYNGFDVSRIDNVTDGDVNAYREKLGIPEMATVVGSIFRLYPEKDPILWVQTIAEVAKHNKDIYFLLVGVGPMKDEVIQEAKRLNVNEHLILPGTEKHPGLPLSLMDAFLLTSKMEGTPNVIIEAQWMRVPVVATDAGGSKEAFVDGKTGYLSPMRDPLLLSDMVISVLENKEWSNTAKESSREFIKNRFGRERMIEEFLSFYKIDENLEIQEKENEEIT